MERILKEQRKRWRTRADGRQAKEALVFWTRHTFSRFRIHQLVQVSERKRYPSVSCTCNLLILKVISSARWESTLVVAYLKLNEPIRCITRRLGLPSTTISIRLFTILSNIIRQEEILLDSPHLSGDEGWTKNINFLRNLLETSRPFLKSNL